MTKRIATASFIMVALLVTLTGAVLTSQPVHAASITDCVTGSVYGDGTAKITNNCTDQGFTVGLASYKMYDGSIDNQTLFDATSRYIGPGQSFGRAHMHVAVSNCNFQLDLFEGDALTPPVYGTPGHALISYLQMFNRGQCGHPTPTPSPSPSATPTPTLTPTPSPTRQLFCNPSTQTIFSSQNVMLSATGGNGLYYWFAPNGDPTFGFGNSFTTRYVTNVVEETHAITLESGNASTVCYVRVLGFPTPTPTPSPTAFWTLNKTVRDVITGSGDVETLAVTPGATVEFVIRAYVGGNTGAFNVRVNDLLPANLSYVSGSTTVDGFVYGDGVTDNGLFLGTVGSGRTMTIRFRAVVAGDNAFVFGTTNVVNYATIVSDNLQTLTDPATVAVVKTSTVIIPAYQLTITKLGMDVSRGQAQEQLTLFVGANDTLQFNIHIRSLSTVTTTNVIVTDILPAGLTYINRSTSVDNIQTGDTITTSGLNIGSLVPNQEVIVRFSALVDAGTVFPSGTTHVTNIAQVRADNVPILIATLPVIRGSVLGASTVNTGAGETVVLALLLSALTTMLYMGYTRTGVFNRRLALAAVRRHTGNPDRLNFMRFLV